MVQAVFELNELPAISPPNVEELNLRPPRFDQIVAVHPLSRTATVQAGIYGPALEAGLKPHGLTLRHSIALALLF